MAFLTQFLIIQMRRVTDMEAKFVEGGVYKEDSHLWIVYTPRAGILCVFCACSRLHPIEN